MCRLKNARRKFPTGRPAEDKCGNLPHMITLVGVLSVIALVLPGSLPGMEELRMALRWNVTTLDADFPGGYQVQAADVNGDGRIDVVGLGTTVAWLESPAWRKHPITGALTRDNIDLAAYDIDGDGKLEIAIASGFQLDDSTAGGNVSWFHRAADLDQPWTEHHIDSYPTAHRLRWADVDGSGHKVLVCAPILGRGSKKPQYDQSPAPLMLYRIPKDPAKDPWPRQIVDQALHITHGLLILDFDGDGREEILTASLEGVSLFHSTGTQDNLKWTRTLLCAGEQSSIPGSGASEVQVGRLVNGNRFIATIEPWHGDEVAVYLESPGKGGPWQRIPVDSTFNEGHALAVIDLDGDGGDEIVAGFRGKRHGVVAYRAADSTGLRWEKEIIDEGGIACQGFFIAALSGAGGMQPGAKSIIGIGGATHNVKRYEVMSR